MRTTTYKCDRCGAEDTSNTTLDLKGIKVGIFVQESYFSRIEDYSRRQQEWCKKCRLAVGIDYPKPEIAPTSSPVPSLEDMIREIVREEINNQ